MTSETIALTEDDIEVLANAVRDRLLTIKSLPELLTGDQVQRYLKISRTTRWRMERSGKLHRVRVRGGIRYRREDILKLL